MNQNPNQYRWIANRPANLSRYVTVYAPVLLTKSLIISLCDPPAWVRISKQSTLLLVRRFWARREMSIKEKKAYRCCQRYPGFTNYIFFFSGFLNIGWDYYDHSRGESDRRLNSNDCRDRNENKTHYATVKNLNTACLVSLWSLRSISEHFFRNGSVDFQELNNIYGLWKSLSLCVWRYTKDNV